MNKLNRILVLAAFSILISACGGGSDRYYIDNELGFSLSGRSWCLDRSVSLYQDGDFAERFPLTEVYTFEDDGVFYLDTVSKFDRSQVVDSISGYWSTGQDFITFRALGEINNVDAVVNGSEFVMIYSENDFDRFYQCNYL